MIAIEVCVHSKNDSYVFNAVSEAWQGGADRIELCSHMEQDGLTPCVRHIELAREAFKDRPGLLAMIRPAGGDFFFSRDEIDLMERQIVDGAKAGADGIVIGVLDKKTSSIHREYCRRLLERAREHELSVTFHRAFDATFDATFDTTSNAKVDWQYSLEILVELGVDRVLSSGISWGKPGTAMDGIGRLNDMARFVSGNLEVVVGGGVSLDNADMILGSLQPSLQQGMTDLSLHTYSAMLEGGRVSSEKVHQLKSLVAAHE